MPSAADILWLAAKPDDRGLVTAVVQHATDQRVLMVAAMSREALHRTLERGQVTFFSRSRQALWTKGETSGNTLRLVSLRIDCDGDAVLVQALPAGPTCHTGASSCFFRFPGEDALVGDDGPPVALEARLRRVFDTVLARKAGVGMTASGRRSYVRDLLAAGAGHIGDKLREEADELARALAAESDDRVASEAADLLFHAMVALAARDLTLDDVAAVLDARHGTSGLTEKASRATAADP
jgi:phosphoribosyl-AMP cyclohydrolase / phosphoribosyl-ATP pyrophosphohydrolase